MNLFLRGGGHGEAEWICSSEKQTANVTWWRVNNNHSMAGFWPIYPKGGLSLLAIQQSDGLTYFSLMASIKKNQAKSQSNVLTNLKKCAPNRRNQSSTCSWKCLQIECSFVHRHTDPWRRQQRSLPPKTQSPPQFSSAASWAISWPKIVPFFKNATYHFCDASFALHCLPVRLGENFE